MYNDLINHFEEFTNEEINTRHDTANMRLFLLLLVFEFYTHVHANII